MDIRPARPKDAPAMAEIYHAGWHQAHGTLVPPAIAALRTPAAFASKVPGLVPRSVVAAVDGSVAGFATTHGAELGQLFVAAAWQRRGVARCLLDATEDGMRQAGVSQAVLFCVVGNQTACDFYLRHGWSVAATEAYPAQLDGGGTLAVPVWRMAKTLA